MTRAALYLRVSTADQAERSIPAQEAACRAFADAKGWTTVAVFRDEGVSAYKLNPEERPGFREALTAAEAHEIDVLIIDSYDRLSRREDQEGILGVCWRLGREGVKVESASESTPEDAALASLLRLMMGVTANQESRRKSERSKRGTARRLKEGKHTGRAAYGYRADGAGGLEIDPDASTVVRRIFDEWNAGTSQSEIARSLTKDGVPTARGGAVWEQATVGVILRNRVYRGEIKTADGYAAGAHSPIVTETQFDQAQLRMAPGGTKRQGGREAAHHLLARLLRCGDCGSVMRARRGRIRPSTGQPYETYVCPHANGKYGSSCQMKPVPRALLDEAVLRHFTDHVVDLDRTREAFRVAQQGRMEQLKAEADALGRAFAQKQAAERRIREDYKSGRITPEAWMTLEPELRADRAAAEQASNTALDRYNEAESASPPDDVEARVAAALSELHSTVANGLDSSETVASLRAQLEKVFERFELHRGELEPEDIRLPAWPAGHEASPPNGPTDDQAHIPYEPADRVPDDLVGASEWTLFPVLRPEVVAELETSYRPAAAVLPVGAVGGSLSADEVPIGADPVGPATDSSSTSAPADSHLQGNPETQNYNEGLAT